MRGSQPALSCSAKASCAAAAVPSETWQSGLPLPRVKFQSPATWSGLRSSAVAATLYYFGAFAPRAASESATVYYCPMHPSVVQDRPGECPICSMTLVEKPAARKEAKGGDAMQPGAPTMPQGQERPQTAPGRRERAHAAPAD